MTLAAKLAFGFDKRVQFKGHGLLRSGAIRIEESSADRLQAKVQGGRLYSIVLHLQKQYLSASCECTYFSEWGPCKHLWAAVLEADRIHALTNALQVSRLTLIPVEAEEDGADEVDEEFQEPDEEQDQRPFYGLGKVRYPVPAPPQVPEWQEHLTAIERSLQQKPRRSSWPAGFEVWYAVDIAGSKNSGALVLDLLSRNQKKNGDWTVHKDLRLSAGLSGTLPDPADRELLATIFGGQDYFSMQYSADYGAARKTLPPVLALKLLPQLAATGRLAYREDPMLGRDLKPLAWDDGEPWRLWLDVRQDDRDQWKITGSLRRGEERMKLSEPVLLLESGLLVARGAAARFDAGGGFPWVLRLRSVKAIPFPDRERDRVIGKLLECAVIPPLDIDEALRFEQRRADAKVGLRITEKRDWEGVYFEARLQVDYGRGWQPFEADRTGTWLAEDRVFLVRDRETEEKAAETLNNLGLREIDIAHGIWRMQPKSMPRAVRELVHAGWHVEAEGKAFRRPGESRVDVRSGIDWFELHAEVDYGGATATLPQLLAALRRGDTMVRLGDGTFGLLPEEWLERFAPLAGLGTDEEDHLRFRRNQAGLLDALLAAQPEVRVDAVFERAREHMRNFHGVAAAPQPEGFNGKLRDYQREGLGWMEFLREFGFGGCLADDMGVGKTAQVLAVLRSEERRV